MSNLNTELMTALLKNESIDEVFRSHLDTSYGRLHIKVPRDRNGHFEQQLIPDYARRTDELETTLITLYKKGITTREISGGNPKKHLHYKFTKKT